MQGLIGAFASRDVTRKVKIDRHLQSFLSLSSRDVSRMQRLNCFSSGEIGAISDPLGGDEN